MYTKKVSSRSSNRFGNKSGGRSGGRPGGRSGSRSNRKTMIKRNTAKFQISKDSKIDYKNITLLQKYLTERGKIISRRISGVSAREQRQLAAAIKLARHLALLPTAALQRN